MDSLPLRPLEAHQTGNTQVILQITHLQAILLKGRGSRGIYVPAFLCTSCLLRVEVEQAPRHRDADTSSWEAPQSPNRSETYEQGPDSICSNSPATD